MPQQKGKFSADILDLLINIPLFDSLVADELAVVVKSMNVVDAPKGETVFKEGERGDFVCFVADGILEVWKRSETGEPVVLSTLSKGRSMGEMSILDNFPRSATVRARTKATLVTLSRANFDDILEKNPRIGIKILKGLARLLSLNLRKTSSRLADYMLPVT
ncbi:MAG: cyclic nucleotide-binding domain-containing protein [Proteobacteria bacterium]|nr:cyclic nucleotide-binding domain-containing protein [Pseudomonadota bacterium]